MKKIFRQIPLYRFLKYCNECNSSKNILDCGAGGNMPPLLQMERGVPTIDSYYKDSESDELFNDMVILYKEIRIIDRIYEGEKIKQSYVDYILKKI